MKTLIFFELKKILCRKASIAAIISGILLVIVADILPIYECEVNLGEEDRLKGIAALRYQSKVECELTDELTEEFLTDFLKSYQDELKKKGTDLDWYAISPSSNLYRLIASDHAGYTGGWKWEDLSKIPTEGGIRFYEKRNENIRGLLNAEYSYGNYSEKEREYWLNKNEAVRVPFKWGSKDPWNVIWMGIRSLFFQLLVLCVCIVPVFSDEWHLKTDALVLSTRYGRTKLASAKIIASFSFSLLYMLLCGITGFLILACIVGVDGTCLCSCGIYFRHIR